MTTQSTTPRTENLEATYRYQQERNVPMDGRRPYNEFPIYKERGKFECLAICDTEEKAARIVACVNACAGMADPAADLARTRAALEGCKAALEEARYNLSYAGTKTDNPLVARIDAALAAAEKEGA